MMNLKKIMRRIVPLWVRGKIHDVLTVDQVKNELASTRKELLLYKVLYYHQRNISTEFASEVSFLEEAETITPFPYRQVKQSPPIEAYFDTKMKMAYVIHDQKRLYFPSNWSIDAAKWMYHNYIVTENILGGGYTEKAPHQYLTYKFNISEDDTVIDVGAAEGLFLLHVIEKVKKGYLFEPAPNWLAALKATFAPFADKVEIIEKYASNRVLGKEGRLDSYVKADVGDLFIKIDVEGCEKLVLDGAEKVLLQKKKVKVACCTYHQQNDAQMFHQFFKDKGFVTEFSEGYMLFPNDNKAEAPYFRKGIIRAEKK
jgi:hypothetical protein